MNCSIFAQSMNFGMGTLMTHKAFGKNAERSLQAVGDEAERLEKLLSCFMPDSEISRINKSAGMKWERLSKDTFHVLSRAIEFSSCSKGVFDITIGPLVNLWNDSKHASRPPEKQRINQILSLVDYTDLMLDPYEGSARLRRTGQAIDLGGIGKGLAGDRFLEVFRKYDISSAFTNLGGNVVALGTKPDGSPWQVGIQHPRSENDIIASVAVADKAVVTSGDYQRYFIDGNGKRHHHILDPSTGYPAESELVSVTIVADSSTVADALSTIVFIAGMEKGCKILKGYSEVEAIFVDINLQVWVTKGLRGCLQPAEGIPVIVLD